MEADYLANLNELDRGVDPAEGERHAASSSPIPAAWLGTPWLGSHDYGQRSNRMGTKLSGAPGAHHRPHREPKVVAEEVAAFLGLGRSAPH